MGFNSAFKGLIRIMGNNKPEAAVTSRSRQNYIQINYRIIILQTDSQDCTMHLHTIEYFIYPTDAQLDCSKNVKIYMRGAPTCFSFSHPSSGNYYMCFAKVHHHRLYSPGWALASV